MLQKLDHPLIQHKLAQLRAEMDRETTTDKIEKIKAYLKVVKEKLKVEQKRSKTKKSR